MQRQLGGSLFVPGLFFVLMVAMQLPGVVALRNAVFFILLLVFLVRRSEWAFSAPVKSSLKIFALFIGWALVNDALLSWNRLASLREIISLPVEAAVFFILGYFFTKNQRYVVDSADGQVSQVFFATVAAMAGMLIVEFWLSLRGYTLHHISFWQVTHIFKDRSYASAICNMTISLFFVDMYAKLYHQRSLVPCSFVMTLVMLGILLFLTMAFGTRNGVIGVAFMLLSFSVLVLIRAKIRKSMKLLIIGSTLASVLALAIMDYREDTRWHSFRESAEAAWHTERNLAWLLPDYYALPKTSAGLEVDASAYERLSWAKEGATFIVAHPLGIGLTSKPLGWVERALHPEEASRIALGSSHSGVVDIGICLGIPGILLWYFFGFSLVKQGYTGYRKNHNHYGLVLFFVALGYLSRVLVDGHFRNQFLLQFMLLAGMLFALTEIHCLPLSSEGKNLDES